jgi:hypothetical protein
VAIPQLQPCSFMLAAYPASAACAYPGRSSPPQLPAQPALSSSTSSFKESLTALPATHPPEGAPVRKPLPRPPLVLWEAPLSMLPLRPGSPGLSGRVKMYSRPWSLAMRRPCIKTNSQEWAGEWVNGWGVARRNVANISRHKWQACCDDSGTGCRLPLCPRAPELGKQSPS